MKTATLTIQGMHCEGCSATIQALLQRTEGVQKTAVSFKQGEARLLYDSRLVTPEQLIQVIQKAGFDVTGRSDD